MKRLIVSLFFVFLTCLVMLGFRGSNQLPDVHDPTIAYRTQITIDSLVDGQFPPAWHNTLNFGFGYPLNLYYAPLITYLTAIAASVVGNVVFGVKLTLWLITLLGIVGVYKLVIKYGLSASLVASTAFAMLPYHASALYVRGSYAEYLAINLLPWVIYFWTKSQSQKKNMLFTVITTGIFLISHNTIPFLALPVIITISLLSQKNNYKSLILTLLLSFALSAVFLVPIFFERGFIQVDAVATKTRLSDHFVTPAQLWYSPWGYGGSTPGDADLMSFMLGKGQIVLAILGLIFAAVLREKLMLYLTMPLLVMLLAVLPLSRPFWDLIPALALLQFPWRVLGIATLSLALGSGYLFARTKNRIGLLISLGAIISLIYTNYTYFRPWSTHTFNHDILTSDANLHPLVLNKIPEYLPAWMDDFPKIIELDGLTRTPTAVRGKVISTDLIPITIKTAYMPHWKLTLNGYPTDIIPNEGGTIRTHAPIPPGTYDVDLTWHQTPIEKFGVVLSLVTLIIVLGLAL